MEAVLIHPNNKADMRLLMNFSKRMGAFTQIVSQKELEERENAALAAIMEERLDSDTEYVSVDEVLNFLRQ